MQDLLEGIGRFPHLEKLLVTDEQLSDWREIVEGEEYDDKDKTEDNERWLSSMLATPGRRHEAAKAFLGACPGLRELSFVCKEDGVTYRPQVSEITLGAKKERVVEPVEMSVFENDYFAICVYRHFRRMKFL